MTLLAQSWRGVRAAAPTVIGYLPVSMTFGAAATASGLDPVLVVSMSALIFAGASQFILLAAIKTGAPWLYIVALCGLVNSRHLLYGPLLIGGLPASLRARMGFAFALTDEVFATSLAHFNNDNGKAEKSSTWLAGLAVSAYLAWTGGTVLGVYLGAMLEHSHPEISKAMLFSLPALFLALAYQSYNSATRWPIFASALCAGWLANIGHTAIAIVAGAVVGCLFYRRVP